MGDNADDRQVQESLVQLRCHFTWGLVVEDSEIPDLESRVLEEIAFLDTKFNVGIHNLLAYVKHLQGLDEEALQSLRDAEDLTQRQHADKSDMRSLVTWGNYAWLYYHMGKLEKAKLYLDKVENICQKFASPFRYRVECPEMDCEEGWALLKCGGQYQKQAKVCFEKALQAEPENPEFSTGFAIATYRQDFDNNLTSLEPLRHAVRLNPGDAYIKVLLALKLQDAGKQVEAEEYILKALHNTSSQVYVFRYASKFYRRNGCVDKALELLEKALQATPSSAYLHYQVGLCYRAQVLQIKNSTNMQPRGQDREQVDKLVQLAIAEFQKTLMLRPTFELAYVTLAEMYAEIGQFRMAEDNFQKVLVMENIADHLQQEIHLRYGRFLQFHQKSEDKAITHYLKGLKLKEISCARRHVLKALEQLAKKRLNRNVRVVESLSLLGLIHKLRGEVNEALLCYEKALRLTGELNPMF